MTTTTTAYTYEMPETTDLYELQTIHRGSKLEVQWTPQKMANSKREKKTSLTFKERLFGPKKSRKASGSPNPKYDVVRSLDIVDGSNKARGDKKKDDYILVHPTYIRGHKLEVHSKTSWCDSCQELIWGVNIQAVRCQHCKYTCHTKCVSSVYVECSEAPTQKSQEDLTKELEISSDLNTKNKMENNNLPTFVTSISELKKLIDEYNLQSNLLITLHNDFTFDGFIRVHMNLNRPINVNTDVSNLTLKKAVARNKAGTRRRRPVTEIFPAEGSGSMSSTSNDSGISSNYSNDSTSPPLSPSSPLSPIDTTVLNSMYNRRKAARRLSFYMPKGTYKPLHVTSSTTVREVIEALLSKYNVTDNPRKYCLFEKHREKREDALEHAVTFRRLKDADKPLILMLSWGAGNSAYSFSMKEDDTGNIEWMNFEVPELNNFLKILQEEEDKLIAQIFQKYDRYRDALENAMEPFLS